MNTQENPSGAHNAQYLIRYGQTLATLCGKMKIYALFLKERFGVVITRDRNEDLISIEPLDANQGFIIKKLTFRCSVEYKDGVNWKSMLISDTTEIASKGEIKIGKYCFIVEFLATDIQESSHLAITDVSAKANTSIVNPEFKFKIQSNEPALISSTCLSSKAYNEQLNELMIETSLPVLQMNEDKEVYEKVDKLERKIENSMWEYYTKAVNDGCLQLTTKANDDSSQSNRLKNVFKQRDLNLSLSNSFASDSRKEKASKGFIANPFKFTYSQKSANSEKTSQNQQNTSYTQNFRTNTQENNLQMLSKASPNNNCKKFLLTSHLNKTNRRIWQNDSPGQENIAYEISELEPKTKKAKKNDKQRDEFIHKELENQMNSSKYKSSEEKPGFLRRKFEMEPEEEDAKWKADKASDITLNELTSSSISDDSQTPSKYSFKVLLESGSKGKESSEKVKKIEIITESNDEDEDKKSLGSRPQSSKLALQQLKQLVVEKREAAAKKSLDKSVANQSQIPRESCTICLSEITEEIGRLESCVHVFCFNCIVDWAKFANECPLCKRRFNEIVKYSEHSVKIESIPIKFKNQTYECDWEEIVIDSEAEDNCYICDSEDNPDVLLVCDRCHFKCCHTYCCNPPLESIPEDEWTCVYCTEQGYGREGIDGQPRRSNRYQLRNRNRNVTNQSLLARLFLADELIEETKEAQRPRLNTRQAARNVTNNTTGLTRTRNSHQNNLQVSVRNNQSRITQYFTNSLSSLGENRSGRTGGEHSIRLNSLNGARAQANTRATKQFNRSRIGPMTRSRSPF